MSAPTVRTAYPSAHTGQGEYDVPLAATSQAVHKKQINKAMHRAHCTLYSAYMYVYMYCSTGRNTHVHIVHLCELNLTLAIQHAVTMPTRPNWT